MSSSLGIVVSLALTCAVACMFMLRPVLIGVKFECCVRFNHGFYPFINHQDLSHYPFA